MVRRMISGLLLLVIMSVLGVTLMPQTAQAATEAACIRDGVAENFLGFPPWYRYLEPEWTGTECLVNFDFERPGDYAAVLLAVFEVILRVSGIVAVIGIVYGGFQYITSAGEPDKAAGGRTTIINALIGMFITIMATVIVNLIGRTL